MIPVEALKMLTEFLICIDTPKAAPSWSMAVPLFKKVTPDHKTWPQPALDCYQQLQTAVKNQDTANSILLTKKLVRILDPQLNKSPKGKKAA